MFHPHAPDHDDDLALERCVDFAVDFEFDDDDDDDASWPAPAEPPQTHDGMPIRGWHYGEPIPDLDRIPQERWREVLVPLRHATRQVAMSGTQTDVRAAAILYEERRDR